jgi:hypothetical protein
MTAPDPAPASTVILRHVLKSYEAFSDDAFLAALDNAGFIGRLVADLAPFELRALFQAMQFLEMDGGGGHHAKYWGSHSSLTGLSDDVHQLAWRVAQAMTAYGLATTDLNKIRNRSYGHDRLACLEAAEAQMAADAKSQFLRENHIGDLAKRKRPSP